MAAEHVERIGARIRQRRDELGLSQDDLARAMPGKTNGNAIYRWETGKHEPRAENLQDLATALDVDVSYFYVEPAKKEKTPDLGAALNGNQPQQLDRIEANQTDLKLAVAALESTVSTLAGRITLLEKELREQRTSKRSRGTRSKSA